MPLVGAVYEIQLGAETRPALIVADPKGSPLVSVCPLVRHSLGDFPFEVPHGERFIRPDHLHSVSRERLKAHLGNVDGPTLEAVREKLRIILGLSG